MAAHIRAIVMETGRSINFTLCIKRKEKISGVFHRSLFINMNGVLLVKAIVMDQFHHMQKKSKKKHVKTIKK